MHNTTQPEINGGTGATNEQLAKREHKPEDIDLLFRIYIRNRLNSQADFYRSRLKEYEFNSDFTFGVGAFILMMSSLVATVSASGNDPFLSLMAAFLPALAALVASFRQLYAWDKQVAIYRDSVLGLERVGLLIPDDDRYQEANIQAIFPQLFSSSEQVLMNEVSQWGQVEDTEGGDKKTKAISDFTALFGSSIISADGQMQLSAGQLDAMHTILAASVTPTRPTIEITRETDDGQGEEPRNADFPHEQIPYTPVEEFPSSEGQPFMSEVGGEDEDFVPDEEPDGMDEPEGVALEEPDGVAMEEPEGESKPLDDPGALG